MNSIWLTVVIFRILADQTALSCTSQGQNMYDLWDSSLLPVHLSTPIRSDMLLGGNLSHLPCKNTTNSCMFHSYTLDSVRNARTWLALLVSTDFVTISCFISVEKLCKVYTHTKLYVEAISTLPACLSRTEYLLSTWLLLEQPLWKTSGGLISF
jgi:hypothetical protein